jgi:hypothetical protein
MLHTCFKQYKQSLTTTLTSTTAWIIIISYFVIETLFVLVLPWLIADFDPNKQSDMWMIQMMINMSSMLLVPFFSSIIGEINANAGERIFVLSRPTTRFTYFSAKFLSSFTLEAVMWTYILLLFWSINQVGINNNSNIFVSTQWYWAFFTILCLSFFGMIVGIAFRYYAREFICSVLVLLIAAFYTIVFSLFTNTSNSDLTETIHIINLEFKTLPMFFFLPVSIILCVVGFTLNTFDNVKI